MPNYVPIQDMTISHDLEDTDLVPVSDGNTSFAVAAARFKAYSTDAAEAVTLKIEIELTIKINAKIIETNFLVIFFSIQIVTIL